MKTPNSVQSTGPKFFVDHKKGEVVELMNLLKNPSTDKDPVKKKDLIKRVIAYMTLGVDVSKLFFEMVKASITDDIVLKKMIFLYIVNYAEEVEQTEPGGALLAVNTFLRDMNNSNPKIKGLALRSLCALKFKGAYEYYSNALYDSLKDAHPYVRKTAVIALLKVYHFNPKLISEKDIDTLYEMIGDKDPLVMMNVLFVLGELLKKQGGIALSGKMINHLLNIFKELNEWGQCIVLDLVAKYVPKEQKQMFDIMNILEEYLKLSSSAIVLGVAKVFINFTKDDETYYPQVIKRLRDPMITLLLSCETVNNYELSYSILSHIYFLILKGGQNHFSEIYKKFFVKFEEPEYVKKMKLEIMVQIANDFNYTEILNEMEEYVNDVSPNFSKYTIKKIGALGFRVDSSLVSIVNILKGLLNRSVDFIVSESLTVLRDLARKYPAIIKEFVNYIIMSIQAINNDPKGLSSLTWIIGEFGDSIDDAPYILDYLSKIEIQSNEFAYSLLLACCKMFFKSPGIMQPILGRVFEYILKNYQDVDLRDRALYYYNLLKNDINNAAYIIYGEQTVVDYFYADYDQEFIDQIFSQFNTLSIIYRKPAEKFTKTDLIEEDTLKPDREEQNQPQENQYEEQQHEQPQESLIDIPNVVSSSSHDPINKPEQEPPVRTIGQCTAETLCSKYPMDNAQYYNFWNSYSTFITNTHNMITNEIDKPAFIEYLKDIGILTIKYAPDANANVSTMFLYSVDQETKTVFLSKLILDEGNHKLSYEIKTQNVVNVYIYDNYFKSEAITPLMQN